MFLCCLGTRLILLNKPSYNRSKNALPFERFKALILFRNKCPAPQKKSLFDQATMVAGTPQRQHNIHTELVSTKQLRYDRYIVLINTFVLGVSATNKFERFKIFINP
jgi:hypothetical protein